MGKIIQIPLQFKSEHSGYAITAEVGNYGGGSVTLTDTQGQRMLLSGSQLDAINIVRKGLRDE